MWYLKLGEYKYYPIEDIKVFLRACLRAHTHLFEERARMYFNQKSGPVYVEDHYEPYANVVKRFAPDVYWARVEQCCERAACFLLETLSEQPPFPENGICLNDYLGTAYSFFDNIYWLKD